MNSAIAKKRTSREQRAVETHIRRLREEITDLMDALDLLEARASDRGKPTYSIDEVRKKLRLTP